MVSSLSIEYKNQCSKRAFNTRETTPEHIRERVDACAKEVFERFPEVSSLQLTGSYPAGGYADQDSDQEFLELRKNLRGHDKISDIDFITEPKRFAFFLCENGFKVHCTPFVHPGTPIIKWIDRDDFK